MGVYNISPVTNNVFFLILLLKNNLESADPIRGKRLNDVYIIGI